MTIAIETILALLGAVLLLTAGIGGGFEIKSVKVPQVGLGGRIISLVMGAVCLLAAIGMGVDAAEAEEEDEAPAEEIRMGLPVEDDPQEEEDEDYVPPIDDPPPLPPPPPRRPPPPPDLPRLP